MDKKISEMSLQELWNLFPIILTEHNIHWRQWYQEEATNLTQILPSDVWINHIGSTAIYGIWAKPIIDILVEVSKEIDFEYIKELLIGNEYICMSQSTVRLSFNKGYTENGFAERVFHLHLRRFGDNAELYFRDYLNEHEEVAKGYQKMKLELWKEYEHNRDGYTNAKAAFINKYTAEAKELYQERYCQKHNQRFDKKYSDQIQL